MTEAKRLLELHDKFVDALKRARCELNGHDFRVDDGEHFWGCIRCGKRNYLPSTR